MIIGARAHDFGRHSPNQLASIVKRAGFEGVQLALTKAITGIENFDQVTDGLLDEVRAAFVDEKVEISVMGCYIEPSLPDRNARLEQVRRFNLGLEHAKKLNVDIAGTETTHFPPDGEGREAAFALLLDSVLRMTEKAEKLGVNIGIETVADNTLSNAVLTRRLIDEVNSSRLKVIFDPVNLILPGLEKNQESIYAEFFDMVGQYICAVHMKDIVINSEEKVWRNIGDGLVRYDLIMPWIINNKQDIPLLREHVHPESAGRDIQIMRQLANLKK